MSVPVALERLVEEASLMGSWVYVLTVSDDGRPHAVAAVLSWSDAGEMVASVGHRSLANACERPAVSLLWPPIAVGGHSLIVDGTARVEAGAGRDGLVMVTPSRAVYHRPAPLNGADASCAPGASDPSGCGPVHEA